MNVAVVGAGLAGASAAHALVAAGHHVTAFDKSRGVGGRMSTRRRESDAFDHGAQYFTAHSEAFKAKIADWCDRGLAASWDGRIVRLAAGQVSEERGDTTRYVGMPKMSLLARDLLEGATIACSARIERATREGAGYRLTTEEGKDAGVFDCVVLASPAAQSEVLLREGFDTDECRLLADRIRSVEVDPCHAVMVRFRGSVEAGFDGAFVEDEALSWMARGASKPGRPDGQTPENPDAESWLLHSAPDWSRAHVDDEADSVGARQLESLTKSLGRPLPEVESVSTHRWLYARTQKPLGEESIWNGEQGIGLCGDWLRGARVEDAFLSGQSLAQQITASR